MSDMNFIPASMALAQCNQRLMSKGFKAICLGAALLGSVLLALIGYNKFLSTGIESFNTQKNAVNQLLAEKTSAAENLRSLELVAASLSNLNSFSALSQTLEMISASIPDETALDKFDTEFNESGESIITLEGVADSHHHLTDWVLALKSYQGVKTAELLSSDAIQNSADDALKQRFSLRVTRTPLTEKTS